MKIRILPLTVGLALSISLSSAVDVMLNKNQTAGAWNDAEFIDITSFVKGETLSVDLGNTPLSLSDLPLRPTQADSTGLLRSGVNVPQLIAQNNRKQLVETKSKQNIAKFAKKLPKLGKVKNIESYFAHNSEDNGTRGTVEEMLQFARIFKGTPYRRGGLTERGFDCSGFTLTAYRHIGVKLPRTSHSQSQVGQTVSVEEAQPGDLVFFGRKRKGSYRTDHTGIVVENNNGSIRFIHSSRRGVVVDDLFSVHSYRKKFLFIKRVL